MKKINELMTELNKIEVAIPYKKINLIEVEASIISSNLEEVEIGLSKVRRAIKISKCLDGYLNITNFKVKVNLDACYFSFYKLDNYFSIGIPDYNKEDKEVINQDIKKSLKLLKRKLKERRRELKNLYKILNTSIDCED